MISTVKDRRLQSSWSADPRAAGRIVIERKDAGVERVSRYTMALSVEKVAIFE